MKFFINLSVRKKLSAVFSVVCIFIVLIGVQGVLSSSKINEGSNYIYSDNLISIKDLEEIKVTISEMRSNMLRIIFEKDNSKLDQRIKTIDYFSEEYEKFKREYESIPLTPEEKKHILILRMT